MKAISIHQPWAWLIIHGGKSIENRTWNTKYRGPLVIHVTQRRSALEMETALVWVQNNIGEREAWRVPCRVRRLNFGGIIGLVTLTDVLPPTSSPSNPWHLPGYFGWVLTDPEPLPFRPCGGAQGLWGRFEMRDGQVVPAGGA